MRSLSETERAALVLSRAKRMFCEDNLLSEWAEAEDLAAHPEKMQEQANYLTRAEQALLVEGKIEPVDQR